MIALIGAMPEEVAIIKEKIDSRGLPKFLQIDEENILLLK